MPIQAAPINILTFLQGWTSSAPPAPPQRILFNVLILPKGDPLADFAPSFPAANLKFRAGVIPSLDALPASAAATMLPIAVNVTPPSRTALFNSVAAKFTIRPHGGPVSAAPVAVKKSLPSSYRTATAYARPRTSVVVTDDSYECAIRDTGAIKGVPGTPPKDFYWEEILGFVLRQPLLAQQMGLVYTGSVDLPEANTLAQGGYLYIDLDPASDYVAVTRARFAARVPPLGATPRQLFTPVLFPVDQPGDFDDVFEEADAYDDGFAKTVHGAQPTTAALIEASPSPLPPAKDIGIRLGWDDEQIAIWLNRQLGVNAYSSVTPAPGSPLGVAGYWLDVFSTADNQWHSLVRARGDLSLDGTAIGSFDGELNVEALPVNLNNDQGAQFWLPSYFTAWAGGSLVVTDPTPFALADRMDILGTPVYSPVDADAVPLYYGNNYQFRVRLADLTGGGPATSEHPLYPARAGTTTIPFRRYSRPKAVSLASGGGVAPDNTASYSVSRPLLAYPDIVFTQYPNALALLMAQVADAKAAQREPALPDPDAAHLQVEVQVRALDNDTAATSDTGQPFAPVYSVLLDFPADPTQPLGLNFRFVDVADVGSLSGTIAAPNVPLPLPSSRDVRLVLTPVAADDPNLTYWGSDDSRIGSAPISVYLSAPAADETSLLLPPLVGSAIEAMFLQPDPPPNAATKAQLLAQGLRHEGISDVMDRFASELQLPHSGTQVSSPSGRRTVFGASSGLRTSVNPDRSSLTFSSTSDLIRHWIVVIRLSINRDWTWNGLAASGFEIYRDGALAGRLPLSRAVNPAALDDPDRSQTDIVYFDSVEPKPLGAGFPAELTTTYKVVPVFASAPALTDGPAVWTLRLPITTPPAQVPKVVSAGLAYSEYGHDAVYSSSSERQRMLFLELDGPALDPADAYFARVLAYGTDPLLLPPGASNPSPDEPPLPISPELIRTVAPGQSNDLAGLNTMQKLTPSPSSNRHYLLPIPDGLAPDSAELFGFFVYELRVGHDGSRWSTAQGRFGRPLRVAGVQHPAPQLRCIVTRTSNGVTVVAPYATPVLNGQNLRPRYPRTQLIALLYAQVLQADGKSWRNILLGRATATPLSAQRQNEPLLNPALTPGVMQFDPKNDILFKLGVLGLPLDSSLSVVTVEVMPEPQPINPKATVDVFGDPLGADLGQVRILRTSPLTPVPEICPPKE